MQYEPIPADKFTEEHQRYLDKFRDSIISKSRNSNVIMGAKDINSRHIIATDTYSHIVNLQSGIEVENLLDCEMPCEGTAKFADAFVREDQAIIHSGDINAHLAVLNIHEYGNGLGAKIFCKQLLKHDLSRSILGVTYYAHDVSIPTLFTVLEDYHNQFGSGCSIGLIHDNIKLNILHLSNYEQVVCFLLLLKWDAQKITDFMRKCRVNKTISAYQSISILCEKAGLSTTKLSDLRDALIGMGMHKSMPQSLFNHLIHA